MPYLGAREEYITCLKVPELGVVWWIYGDLVSAVELHAISGHRLLALNLPKRQQQRCLKFIKYFPSETSPCVPTVPTTFYGHDWKGRKLHLPLARRQYSLGWDSPFLLERYMWNAPSHKHPEWFHRQTVNLNCCQIRVWFQQPQETGTMNAVIVLSLWISVTSLQSFGKHPVERTVPLQWLWDQRRVTVTVSPCLLWQYTPPVTKASSQWQVWPCYRLYSGGWGIIYSSKPCDSSLRKQNESCQTWDSPCVWYTWL